MNYTVNNQFYYPVGKHDVPAAQSFACPVFPYDTHYPSLHHQAPSNAYFTEPQAYIPVKKEDEISSIKSSVYETSSIHSNNSSDSYKEKTKKTSEKQCYHPYNTSPSNTTSTKVRRRRKQPHELLSEAQKKANHIASEQKRRQNIKIGFDQLIDIVPSLNHGNRSEALILQKSVEHIRHLVSLKNELKNQVRNLQDLLGDTNYEEDVNIACLV
ncbi:Putative Heteromeric Ino2p/Ino4p transcription factor [Rhizopus microsporus]|nr:Putative Heteromeric Ino2p/Ino4p transcription factor [Rhizopus microsporus]